MVTVRRITMWTGYKKEPQSYGTFNHCALWGHYAPKPHRRNNTARPNASHSSEGLKAYNTRDTDYPKGNHGYPRPPTANPQLETHGRIYDQNLWQEPTARTHDLNTTGIHGITQPESKARTHDHNTTGIHGTTQPESTARPMPITGITLRQEGSSP